MLTVVTGPPCGGKSTYVRANAQATDLLLDLDAIAHAMGYTETQVEWGDDHPAITAARMARAHVLNALLTGRLQCAAWIIDARPDGAMRAQYQRAGAHIITIDPGEQVCVDRAANRPSTTHEGIATWYQHADARLTAGRWTL